MSLAMKRLQNLGWLALVFMVAILLYPLSLNVAATHSDLVAVDREILETKREISFLQAEIRTRASLQQLEEWNCTAISRHWRSNLSMVKQRLQN